MPEQMSSRSLGSRVRELRQKRSWSLTDLANHAHLSRSYLFQIEQGNSSPTQTKIQALADALGVRASELLGEEPENVPATLREFAEKEGLGATEVEMLAHIEYRGKKPETLEEWKAIYSVIKAMVGE